MSTYNCTGYWIEEPSRLYDVTISTATWNGEDDDQTFYYTDGEPLAVGMEICDGFVLTHIDQ